MKKLRANKILYTLCFMGFNLIEFLKATQNGAVWQVAVNVTGLLMAAILFTAYPLRELFTKITIGYTVCFIPVMIAVAVHHQSHPGEYLLWQVETAILNIWWMGVLGWYLCRKFDGNIRQLRKKITPTAAVWVLLFLYMLLSNGRTLWNLWFFLMFGMFYLTDFGEEKGKALWDGMLDGTILSFFAMQIYAYGFRPYDTVRYVGAYINCNSLALYYLLVYLCVLVKLNVLHYKYAANAGEATPKGRGNGWKLFYFIGAGGLLSFQLFTICRTAWIVSALLTLYYGITVVMKSWKLSAGRAILRGAALILVVILTFLPVYYTIRWLPTILHYRVWYSEEPYSVDKVHSFDAPDSDKYISLEEYFEEAAGRFSKLFVVKKDSENQETVTPTALYPFEKIQVQSAYNRLTGLFTEASSDSDAGMSISFAKYFVVAPVAAALPQIYVEPVQVSFIEDVSSITRLTIYKTYLEHLTWFGKAKNAQQFTVAFLDGGKFPILHAHNLYLQWAYSYGIPAGLGAILLTVCLLVRAEKKRRRNVENPYSVMPALFTIVFVLFGLTECVWIPGQLVMLFVFFVQHPRLGESY